MKLLLLNVLLLAAAVSAQSVSITGKVSDNAGAPLAGVVVQIFAGQIKTTTAGTARMR